MAIDTSTPTIRPPKARDMLDDDFAAGTAPRPKYETPDEVFRAEAVAQPIQDFAMEGLETPGRFDSQLVQDITSQIDAELANKRVQAGSELDEFMSQRGLVGSSVEGELRRGLYGDLERQRAERLNELNLQAANTFAGDRAAAADTAFRSGELERSLGGDRENVERFRSEFEQGQYESDREYQTNTLIQERALDLQEKGMDLENAREQARLEIQQEQFKSEQEQQKEMFDVTMTETRQQRLQDLGVTQQDFDLRVQQLQQEAIESGRTLDLAEAQFEADRDLRVEQLEQEARNADRAFNMDDARLRAEQEQYQQDHRLRQEELAQRADLDQKLYREQVETRQAEYRDRQEARVAEMALQNDAQGYDREMQAMNRVLEERALQMQEDGMDNEAAWREADRALTEELETKALELQERSLSADEALRYAEIEASRELAAAERQLEKDLQQLQLEFAGEELSERTAEREARFEELKLQRLSTETIQTEANRIAQDGITKEAAWREAANTLERDMQSENRKLAREEMAMKKWATEEDLQMREREFKVATDSDRLRMILQALSTENVDEDVLEEWITKYSETRPDGTYDPGPSSGGGDGTNGDGTNGDGEDDQA